MRRPDENTLVVSLVEGPEILNGLKITRKFSEDGLQMVRSIALFDINNDAVNETYNIFGFCCFIMKDNFEDAYFYLSDRRKDWR